MNACTIPALVVVAALAPAAMATDRYYPDSYALSSSGRYRVDAKSPDNAGEHPKPFAANFTYTLTDTTTGEVLWTRKQPMRREKGDSYSYPDEGSPMQVFVHDDGRVAAHLAGETLLLLGPNGCKLAEAEILGAFPTDEQQQFVSRTTAGPMWAQDSDWSFVAATNPPAEGAATYFVIRPYWHKRLIVDASTGKHVDLGEYRAARSADELAGAPAEVRLLLTPVLEEETRRALAALAAAPESLEKDYDYKARRALSTALHTVVFLKLDVAELRLRSLEAALGAEHDPYFDLRPKVREALRAVGAVPAPGCGVQLYPLISTGSFYTDDTDHPYTPSVSLQARLANARQIAPGMTLSELTDLIGCPDAELHDGAHCYDYDIDAPEPYTLRVFLDRMGGKVERVQTIMPLAFLHDAARLRGY